MEIYVLDTNLNRVGIVDQYESFLWNTSYNKVGNFRITCPMAYFQLLRTEMLIQTTEDDYHTGIIEHVEKEQNDDGHEYLIVSGKMLETYLKRRICRGAYTYESMQPAQIISALVNKNAISPSDSSRKIEKLKIGKLDNADEGSINYAGENQNLLAEVNDICIGSQLGYRLYADDLNKKFVLDIYKGENRTEEENTTTEQQIKPITNILNNGNFNSGMSGWTQVEGGSNWRGEQILYVSENIFKKRKIKDRYAEYWETTGNFKEWVYFFRKTGYIFQNVNLKKEHIYFIDFEVRNPTDTVLGFGIKENGNYTFAVERCENFKRYSSMYVPPANSTYMFALADGEIQDVESLTVEVKYACIIDLTATFGVGKEPDLEWCKNNIYYSAGWKYKIEIIKFIPNHNDPLVFSRDRDILTEIDYMKDITNEATYMYVQGDTLNTTLGSASGIARKEVFLDVAGEIKRIRDGITIPEASYIAMIKARAMAVFRKLTVNEIVDGKFYLLSNKKFRRDFDLGDIVSLCDETLGFSLNLRITAAMESWSGEGYQLSITFGDEVPDIYETVKLISKGAK